MPGTKPSSNRTARPANASSSEESQDCSESEKLTAGMLTKALDSLKFDICSKIELAIGGVQADIAAVREELTSSVTSLHETVNDQGGRLKELETSAAATCDSMSAMKRTVSELQSQVKVLQTKCEDLENRSRRNNIRLVGIPEDQEGTMVIEFVSNLLQEVLRLDEKPLLNRAHRSPQAKPKPNQPPRPFIIRVHYFHVRELILRQARQLQSLSFNGRAIHIFPDLTAAEAKRRAAFGDVRKRLREVEGARFWFRLPAKFRITLPGAKERMFTDPQLALD
ncbi:hypothetical protein ACEWY4_022590 [Coilia grayii]|uniref:Transposase element L1Md-A101/L1Md-A102/L1Md-A2 n=1 Tax=Coilia grayii TaxID=363190 RepID=A0ABD1J6D4_9TELE